jgi:hypothetical protein
MSFEPCSILFYGGPMHGRIMTVDRPTYVVHTQGPPQFLNQDNMTECAIPAPKRFYYNYTPIKNLRVDIDFHNHGVTNTVTQGYAMVCDIKKYDSAKVWRMMQRYKTIPGYSEITWPVPQ